MYKSFHSLFFSAASGVLHVFFILGNVTGVQVKISFLSSRDISRVSAMAIENTTGNNDFATIYTRDSLANDSCQEYDSAQARVFKIIVIGDSSVGKTCLTYRFCGGKFLQNPEATIGVDFRERTLRLDGENIKVRIRAVEYISQI